MPIRLDFMKPFSLAAFALLLVVVPATSQGLDFKGVVEGVADELIRREKQDGQSADQRDGPTSDRRGNRSSDQQGSQPYEQQAPAKQAKPRAERVPAQTVDIRSIQQILTQLGYSPGVADGLMGQNTKRAIQEFQRDQELDIDGVPSPQLLERLRAVAAARQSGATVAGSTPRHSSDEISTDDLTDADLGQKQSPAGVALEGSDAYAALLDLYIREHPDAARHPEFLPYFAGLGCRAGGWQGKRNLNPFELAEIESAAQAGLDRKLTEARASAGTEPVLVTFRADLTAGDYDMTEGVFPVRAGRSIEANIRPDDFCQSVARAKDLRHRSVFPVDFRIAAADGASLEPSHVAQMLGGKVAIGSKRARSLYNSSFPTIVVEVTGRVRSVARAKAGVGFVTLEPVRAALRSQGSAPYSQELAVLGPEQLGSFAVDAEGGSVAPDGADALMRFDRDVYLIGSADLTPSSHAIVQYSNANLDASEAEALTGAITGAIGADPKFVEHRNMGAGDLALSAISFEAYALVAGDWRGRITHAIESSLPEKDFSVIQIAGAAKAALTDQTSGMPNTSLPATDFGSDDMPIARAWIPHYLENTSRPEQIEALKAFITRLHQARDYRANAVFAEGEIKGHQPEFLARSVLDRWLAVLEEQSAEPPFNMAVQVEARHLEYDFDRGDLVLFSGYDEGRTFYDSHMYKVLKTAILSAGGFDQAARLLGIESPGWQGVYIDREIPSRFSMDAGRVEKMIVDRDIVVFQVALRIASIGYEEGNSGAQRPALEAEILGVNVMTDGGEQLSALAPEDLAQIEPEPVTDEAAQVHEMVHLARPRDILAALAAETAVDAAELIESVYPATSQDSFDRQDEITDLATSSQDMDLNGFWMLGYGALADYDLDSEEYGLKYVQLTYPDSVSGNEKRIRRLDLLRLSNVSEGAGVQFTMPEAEARSLRDAMQGKDAPFRARLAVQTPITGTGMATLPLTAELVELVLLRPGSDPRILNDDEVVARVNVEPSMDTDAGDTAMAQSNDGVDGNAGAADYDILGLRVGQPFAEGLSLAQSEFSPERVLHGRRDTWIDANVSRKIEATTPLTESVILVREDARDFLAIFHEPLLGDDPITGIARTIIFAEGSRPRAEAIRDRLFEKYGEIGYENARGYLWTETRLVESSDAQGQMDMDQIKEPFTTEQDRKNHLYNCRRQSEHRADELNGEIERSLLYGRPAFDTDYPLFDASGERARYPKALPLWPLSIEWFRMNESCDTDMVMAVTQQDDSGLVAALRVLVTSRAYLATIEEAAKTALLEQNAAEQTAPEIDL